MSIKRMLVLIGLLGVAGCGGATDPSEFCHHDLETGLLEYCEEAPAQSASADADE